MKALVIGIDAACEPLVEPLVDDGAVPTLRSLMERGVSDRLESQVPPWTPSAWPSVYTGTNPGKHGVFGFLAFDGYDWDVVNATHVRARSMWELLDSEGHASVVVNAPVTHPPPAIEGAVVPGYTAPEHPRCHPAGLLSELQNELGDYRVYAPAGEDASRAEDREWYERLTRMRGAAFRCLVERFAPAFGFVQFQQTDTVCHEHPGDRELLRAVYQSVDAEVGAILDACDPDAVFVVSDHGIGPYDGYEVRVNTHLRDAGFVRGRRGGEGMPSWDAIWSSELQDAGDGPDVVVGEERDENGGASRSRGATRGRSDANAGGVPAPGDRLRDGGVRVLRRAVTGAASLGLTSQRIGSVLDRLGLSGVVLERVPRDLIRAGSEQVDFGGSRAYVRSRVECGVRLNLAGREPDGVVPRDAYEEARSELIETLRSLTTPAGDPVFETVAPRESFFEGPYVADAVDVVTVPSSYDHLVSAQLHPEPAVETDVWNHKRYGLFVAAGPAVDASADPSTPHLFDVAPTVLASLGVARDERTDGRVLPVVESAGVRSYPEYEPAAAVATADEDVERRLSNLGYIE